ncbi:cerebellin-2-like [Ostrea edulis]|uniref:cerebellin-2-like n=1 Tax=Ostrea edulis TaxID=37623 RepID=UPI0024AF2888|nr:cerebellin-2-like [Ostrea edulis]
MWITVALLLLQFSFAYLDKTCDEKLIVFENKLADLERVTTKLALKLEETVKTLGETRKNLEHATLTIEDLTNENIDIKEQLREALRGFKEVTNIPIENASEPDANAEGTINKPTMQEKRRGSPPSQEKRLLMGTNHTTTAPSIKHGIGFTAVTTDHQEHMGIDHTVHFPSVITNDGNGLDPFTSVFRAPTSGLYLFSASILSERGQEVRCAFVKNCDAIAYIFSGDSSTHSNGAKSVLLDLSTNDDVWIKIVGYNDVKIYGGAWSSFMGVLISP